MEHPNHAPDDSGRTEHTKGKSNFQHIFLFTGRIGHLLRFEVQ
jgi:hypothetical protein